MSEGDGALVLRNLLENARRHGAPPTHMRIAADAGTATLTVEDAGPGVTPAAPS